MPLALRSETSRINGAKSHGPKTPQGRAISSLNAIKHGITAKTLTLVNESTDLLLEIMNSYLDLFRWRLRRIWRYQTAMLDVEMDNQAPVFEKRYETYDEDMRGSAALSAIVDQSKGYASALKTDVHLTRMYCRAVEDLGRLRGGNLLNEGKIFQNEPETPDLSHLNTTKQAPEISTEPKEPETMTGRPCGTCFSLFVFEQEKSILDIIDIIPAMLPTKFLLAALIVMPTLVQASERSVAEWVLRVGGSVVLEGDRTPIWDVARLPAKDFQIQAINLIDVLMEPDELKNLSGLANLKELYLCGRTWHSRPVPLSNQSLSALGNLTSLEKLAVSLPVQTEIPLQDPALANLAKLKNLQELRLEQTEIKGQTLAAFTGMRFLDLTHTRFTDAGMQSLGGMTHLSKLYLRDTLVTDDGLKFIQELRELTELDLYGTRITDAGLVYLKNMTGLTKLNLLGAPLTDAGLDQLTGLTKLEELNLYRSKVTNAGLEKLKALKELRSLDVRYTRATGAGVNALKAANPKLEIDFLDVSGAEVAKASRPAASTPAAIAKWVAGMGGKVRMEGGRIREISLASTRSSDSDMRFLAGVPGLEKLDLASTEIGDLGIAKLGGGCALTDLNLAYTTVSDASLKNLARCKSLRRLSLAYTLVNGDGLAALTQLVDLDLSGTAIHSDALSSLGNLQSLTLRYSDITNDGLAAVAGLSNLKRLDLTSTDVGDAGLAQLKSMTSLTELLLSYGRFSDAGLENLKGLVNLTRLDLVKTRTGDRGLESIAALKNLSSLNLDYTSVTDKGLAHLGSLKLAQLRLDSAAVTDASLDYLKSLDHLKVLNLYHTLVSDSGYQALHTALPQCTIIWDRKSALPARRGS
jgi:internalin A